MAITKYKRLYSGATLREHDYVREPYVNGFDDDPNRLDGVPVDDIEFYPQNAAEVAANYPSGQPELLTD